MLYLRSRTRTSSILYLHYPRLECVTNSGFNKRRFLDKSWYMIEIFPSFQGFKARILRFEHNKEILRLDLHTLDLLLSIHKPRQQSSSIGTSL
jgi:hypothetical protein